MPIELIDFLSFMEEKVDEKALKTKVCCEKFTFKTGF
jgi:hypothetical protein